MSNVFQSVTRLLTPPLRPIDRMLSPVLAFSAHRLAGAALLMLATVLAIAIANSPLAHAYHEVLGTHLELDAALVDLDYTLHHWINDGLMSVFFFSVGLEIKRELMVGELSSVRKATLPAIAAIGGMVVPALFYFAINPSGETAGGWGIPMATDIAFALGVLALLGDRIPMGAKVFLTALAIVDDIGAVLVIAVFYTDSLSVVALLLGLGLLLIAMLLNFLDVRQPLAYLLVGFIMWVAFLRSGVHATIAALLMAFTIPASTRINGRDLMDRLSFIMKRLERTGLPEDTRMNTEAQQLSIEAMAKTLEHAQAPLQRIEHELHGFVTFIVLPVFALANAGVTLSSDALEHAMTPVSLGILLGLFLGKQLGITLATWLAVKARLADLPRGVTWGQIYGTSILGGIGFTMSLFIANLAFSAPEHIERAKMGILLASLLSGTAGYLVLSRQAKRSSSPTHA